MTRKHRMLAAAAGVAAWAFVAIAYGQAPRPFPAIDVHVPVPPAPLIAGARTHLGHTPEKVVQDIGRKTRRRPDTSHGKLKDSDENDGSRRRAPRPLHMLVV